MGGTINNTTNAIGNVSNLNQQKSGDSSNSSYEYSTTANQLKHLNLQLNNSQYSVEFDTKSGSKPTWLNIVDKATGTVVFRIPPENIRKLLENQTNPGNVSGLAVNHRI
jgi:uncharacterized FlaG/YvyC family protein